MKYPNFNEERKLLRKGYKTIVGIDEVGRGPLAGPVIACAIFLREAKPIGIKDSKQLTEKQREEIYKQLKKILS